MNTPSSNNLDLFKVPIAGTDRALLVTACDRDEARKVAQRALNRRGEHQEAHPDPYQTTCVELGKARVVADVSR